MRPKHEPYEVACPACKGKGMLLYGNHVITFSGLQTCRLCKGKGKHDWITSFKLNKICNKVWKIKTTDREYVLFRKHTIWYTKRYQWWLDNRCKISTRCNKFINKNCKDLEQCW